MKISEVLRNTKGTIHKILKFPGIVELDQKIDALVDLTNDFSTPVEWLNETLCNEDKEYFIAAEKILKTIYPNGSTLTVKVRKVIDYLSNPRTY
jgi:hypothetical protein